MSISFASLCFRFGWWVLDADILEMEHSLHKSLKEIYCDDHSRKEVPFGDYRIDVVAGDGQLIEIQHGSLSAIKKKCQHLLESHKVLVVKPLIRQRLLIKLDQKGGEVVSKRRSPKRGTWLSAFEELVYFAQVFPNPNLSIEFLLVDVEETRYPGHGRRRRRRESDYQVQELELAEIVDRWSIRIATDLFQCLPLKDIPVKFDTQELADCLGEDRTEAQRIVYCLRETGAIRQIGKRNRSVLYQRPIRKKKRSSAKQVS